jgi:hypothetical protein
MANQDILKSTLAQTSACLAPEQLEALLDGKRSNQHLAECPRCQAELSLLKSFESTEPLRNEGAAVAWISANLERDLENIKRPANRGLHSQGSWLSRIFGVGGMRWVLPAAALAAIVVAGAVMLHTAKEPELRASNTGQPAIYRSQEVQVVSPVGELQQAPTELRWQRFPGAERYRINLMEIDKSSLWNSETKEVNIVIPKTVRDKILPGKPIQWQVTALDATSQVLGTSQIQKFISAGNHSTSSLQ